MLRRLANAWHRHLFALSVLSCKAPGMRGGFHDMRRAVCSSNGKKKKRGDLKKKKGKGVNNLLLMEVLLHLTSHKLCGWRASAQFLSRLRSDLTQMRASAPVKRERKAQKGADNNIRGFHFESQPPKKTPQGGGVRETAANSCLDLCLG